MTKVRWKRFWAAIVVALGVSGGLTGNGVYAQESLRERLGFSWYLIGGVQALDTDELSSSLESQGFEDISKLYPTFGLGANWGPGRLQIGFELRGSGLGPAESPDFKADVSGSLFQLLLGYHAWREPRWFIGPTIGLGAGTLRHRIRPKEDFEYSTTIGDPGKGLDITRTHFTVDLGAGAAYLYGGDPRHRGLIGVRAGYIFALGDSNWNWHDTQVFGGPDSRFKGFYVNLTWGGGWLALSQ